MPTDLECGSEALGRYTCKDAPRPSVCCTNGCCSTSPYDLDMYTGLPLWLRIVVAIFAGLAMVLIFAFCVYRDRRAMRAYTLLKQEEAEERRQQLRSEELHEVHPIGPQNSGGETLHIPDTQGRPSLRPAG
ncbi:conserved hypothetical protein [Leishmania mexicana MHOM/GT/2001/U1103]|uniref:Uncharacterized protein n=1 Tax=Leishmania mexicana (strain MHOM/GT/2001/U1103) TaxID=929439 RepID=E9AWP6_LEIMU|nr:conserved hypothetical protein [Leishmania mexicana MHOM/GT/2001/U1103]CBZ27382.1 conserved hypothetical protein [Leishmania mexicana MHOM/GT/2001/U1103]